MTPTTVFGIDLGTTYSCISYVDSTGAPVIIPNAEGEMTTPSVVYFESPDNIVVGRTAREHSNVYPDRVISLVKRGIGQDAWVFACDGVEYKPQEIAAFILRRLVTDAQSASGLEVKDVVITCPAYFGINQKEATRQAGELAGLNVLGIIPEPTAAALAYIADRTTDQTVLVYDLGGGTFDITLMRLAGDDITVLGTGGDDKLGGRNWDEHLVEYIVNAFCEQTGSLADDLYADQELYQELMASAETCKKNLSSQQVFRKTLRTDLGKAQIDISRQTFEEITRPLLLRTLNLTEDLLRTAETRASHVDKILLVGGSTYMPQVQEGIRERFGLDFEIIQFRPNQAVAEGAALFGQYHLARRAALDEAGKISGLTYESFDELDETLRTEALDRLEPELVPVALRNVVNVSPKGFGILVMTEHGERVRTLIYKDDPIPCEATETFGTYEEGQTSIELSLFENHCADHGVPLLEPDFCIPLSTATLQTQHPLPAQSPVRVTFRITADGLLTINAEELTHGQNLFCRVETESLLSDDELYAAKERVEAFRLE